MGHDEKIVATQALVLRDQTGKVFDAGDVGMIILSGPIAYLNNGTAWVAMNA